MIDGLVLVPLTNNSPVISERLFSPVRVDATAHVCLLGVKVSAGHTTVVHHRKTGNHDLTTV